MARSIFTILDDLASGISELRSALAPLAVLSSSGAGGGAAAGTRGGKRRGRPPGRPRKAGAPASAGASAAPAATARRGRGPARKKAASPKRALQGKYMVALRKLSKADQAEVKKMRADQGVEAALKLAATKAG